MNRTNSAFYSEDPRTCTIGGKQKYLRPSHPILLLAMYSTGRNISPTRRCDTHPRSTVASFCIQTNGLCGTTFLGDKPTRPAHINNLYNTAFWALVKQGGKTTSEAHATLRGTVSAMKQEILFQRFNINYNDISPRFKKGSVLVRVPQEAPEITSEHSAGQTVALQIPSERSTGEKKKRARTRTEVLHCDIIGDEFWMARSFILAG